MPPHRVDRGTGRCRCCSPTSCFSSSRRRPRGERQDAIAQNLAWLGPLNAISPAIDSTDSSGGTDKHGSGRSGKRRRKMTAKTRRILGDGDGGPVAVTGGDPPASWRSLRLRRERRAPPEETGSAELQTGHFRPVGLHGSAPGKVLGSGATEWRAVVYHKSALTPSAASCYLLL